MKNFQELLKKYNACKDAVIWAKDKPIEQIVKECHRGDWLLWLAYIIKVDERKVFLTKGYCAKTVIHLMKDDRSKKAVQAAIDFGNNKINKEELRKAVAAAATVTAVAADAVAAVAAAAYAAYAAYAAAAIAAYAAYAAAVAADAADAAADAAYAADADAKTKNQKQTADICRKYIGDEIIKNVNQLMNLK